MKLPPKETLTDRDHLFLYEHDCHELHNPDLGDFMRLEYVTRFHLVFETIERLALGKRVLDVGCAQGNLSLALAERGYQVVAMDLRHSFLQYLRLKYEWGEVSCVCCTLERFPFRSGTFDVVLLGEVIEHVAYPETLLLDAAKLLATGGILVVTTPNGERLRTRLPTLSAVRDRRELVVRQFEPDAEGHLFELTKWELLRLVQEVGLTLKRHQFFCSPWVTGRLRCRHASRFLPVKLRLLLDRATLQVPRIKKFVAAGQLLVAQRGES